MLPLLLFLLSSSLRMCNPDRRGLQITPRLRYPAPARGKSEWSDHVLTEMPDGPGDQSGVGDPEQQHVLIELHPLGGRTRNILGQG